MSKRVVIFDFDKTLTYSDTTFGFFLNVADKNFSFPVKVLLYIFCMIFSKLKILSNTKLKSFGVRLFLSSFSMEKINSRSLEYSKKIKFNKLYFNYEFLAKKKIFIVSASFVNYLKPLFPKNVVVIGSELLFENNVVTGLKENCFGINKAKVLSSYGIESIDTFYTDSLSDLPLAKISDEIIIVRKDDLVKCNNENDFIKFFKITHEYFNI